MKSRFFYFGRGPHEEAQTKYEREKDDLFSDGVPSDEPKPLTVYSLSEKFLTTKKHFRNTDELSPHRSLIGPNRHGRVEDNAVNQPSGRSSSANNENPAFGRCREGEPF
jgi:hypothetical protein